MTEISSEEESATARQRPSSWRIRSQGIVALLYLMAFVAWEATSMPALVAVILCSKLALHEVATGWWLLRYDPDWRRGRVCFWFHLSWGLWKMAVAATALLLGGVVAAVVLARFGRAPFLGFMGSILRGAVLTAGAGYGLSFLVTYIALASAWWHGVRVWLGSAQHRSRREGFWPPRGGGANRAALVGLTTLILTLYAVGAMGLVTMGVVIAPRFAGLGAGPVAALTAAGLLCSLFVIIHFFQSANRRFFAEKIEDCWPDSPGESVTAIQSP